PDVTKVALTENYRSGQNILDTANALIGMNEERLVDKHLFSSQGGGERVTIMKKTNSWYEASAVADYIAALVSSGVRPSDIAVLYRNNSLSQAVEAELGRRGIRYVVYGGLKFFERAEINDAVAYLRLLSNPRDDSALLRIINVPSRHIGPRFVEQLRSIAAERGCTVYEALKLAAEYGTQKGAPASARTTAAKAGAFVSLMEKLRQEAGGAASVKDAVAAVVEGSGLMDYYKEKDEKENRGKYDVQRHQNLEELVNIASQFEDTHPEEADLPMDEALLEFISSVSLSAATELSEDGSEQSQGEAVNLMTIHSSKGLEFRDVFVIGVESGILPSPFAQGREHGLDEERRLAYVAITRAKRHLWLSFCDQRRVYGRTETAGPSVFLQEIVKAYKGTSPDERPYTVEF
ncbi:MAG: ATP-dependent helicase, partial [Succinivibrio sp.]